MTDLTFPGPPNNEEAEWLVVGCMIVDPDVIPDITRMLVPAAFYARAPRCIYEAILALAERGEPADMVTVAEELRRNDTIQHVGDGETDIFKNLWDMIPNSIHATRYAKIVYDAFRRRKLIEAAGKIAKLAYDETALLEDVVAGSQGLVFGASADMFIRGPRHIKEIVRTRLDEIERLSNGEDARLVVPSGLIDVDRMVGGGFSKSDLILVASRPGMGKTSMLMAIADHAAGNEKKNVAIWAMEMSSEQVVDRAIARHSKIDTQRLRRGDIQDREWPLFLEAIGQLSESNIWIEDTPAIRPSQLASSARKLHLQHGLDLIMVDYLGLMQADTKTDNRVQEVSEISRSLKNLARELNVPVIAASQLNRAVENRQDKRPVLSDLRDSGSLEQDADIVMFIYRDDYYNPETTDRPNMAEVNFAKHRNGPTGVVDLYWQGKLATFHNLQRQEIKLNGSGPPPTHTAATASAYGD